MFDLKPIWRKTSMYRKDERGSTISVFAITLPLLIGAMAVSIEAGYWMKSKSDVQLTADTAAYSGVLELLDTDEDHAVTAAKLSAVQNGFDFGTGRITVNSPPTSGDYQDGPAVEVLITQRGLKFFSGIVSDANIQYQVRAVAAFINNGSEACVMTLEPSEKEALVLNSGSSITAPSCAVQVNSDDSEALYANSNGDIDAANICVNGGYTADGSSDFSSEPVPCESLDNPLAHLPIPDEADDPCTHTDYKIDSDTTLSPGVFCEKFEIDGADVTLQPGIYVIRDGEFTINSGSNLIGDDVMIFFTGGDNTRMNFNSGSSLDIKGRHSGPFAGMAIYQDPSSHADDFIWNSDSGSDLEGTVYIPNSGLMLNSGSSLFADSAWTVLISRTMELNSGSSITLNDDYASSTVPVPAGFNFGADADDTTAGIYIVE